MGRALVKMKSYIATMASVLQHAIINTCVCAMPYIVWCFSTLGASAHNSAISVLQHAFGQPNTDEMLLCNIVRD